MASNTRTLTQHATDTAVTKASDSLIAKGVPVVGVERVLDNPTSVKAWTVAGARTAIAAGLSAAGLGVMGKKVEELLHRIGYKRLAIGLAVVMVLQAFIAGMVIIMAVVIAEETVLKPASIIASVAGKLSSLFDGDQGSKDVKSVPGHICKPVPKPRAAATPPTAVPAHDKSTTDAPAHAPDAFTPPPAVDENGKLIPEAARLMTEVPHGAQALQAETWMLYVMSHPKDDPKSSWDAFAEVYNRALKVVADKKDRANNRTPTTTTPRTAPDRLDQRKIVTPVEIAMQIDPTTFYEPFELAAATMTASLMLENEKEMNGHPDRNPHIVRYTDEQMASVLGRLTALCGV